MMLRVLVTCLALVSLARHAHFQIVFTSGRISADDYRLTGGSGPKDGRLQRQTDATWSTICTDVNSIDAAVANAICVRLGYRVACDFGKGTDLGFDGGPTADLRPFENVDFTACEAGAPPWGWDCTTGGTSTGADACSTGREVLGLRCGSDTGDVELRLTDTMSSFTGVLQARCRGSQTWSAVCSGSSWDTRDADVACRHLGFAFSAARKYSLIVSNLEPESVPAGVLISEFGCAGDESDVLQCQLGLLVSSCSTIPRISCGTETTEYGSSVGLCGNKDLCGAECSQKLEISGLPRRGCQCDDVCVAFGDCCHDYQDNCNPEARDPPSSHSGLPIGQFSCVDVPGFDTTFDGYYLVSFCPGSWLGDEVRSSCELPSNASDVFASIPVYNNITTGVHYKNIYCAICHGETFDQMAPWNVEARYTYLTRGQPIIPDFDVVAPGSSSFTGSFVMTPPDLLKDDIRQCSLPVIDTCLPAYRGTETERGCEALSAPMTHRPSAFSGAITNYRNSYCAKCNDVTLTLSDSCGYNYCELLCTDPVSRCFERCARGEEFLTLDVLFKFTQEGQGLISCTSGEIYDPFLGTCRLVTCSPGYEIQNSACVKTVVPSTVKPTVVSRSPVKRFAYSRNNTINIALVDCLTSLLGVHKEDIVYWDATMENTSDSIVVNFLGANLTSVAILNNALKRLANMTWCNNVTRVAFYLEHVDLLFVDACLDFDSIGTSLFPDYFIQDENSHVTRVLQFDYDSSMQTFVPSEADPACLEPNLTCPSVVVLNSTEFVLSTIENETVVEYSLSGRVLPPGTYVILMNGKAVVCSDYLIVDPAMSTVELAYRYLNLVLTVLSLVALALTFIVFCMVPLLRNLAGQCIMNLVMALFTANLLLLLNGFFIEVPTLCLVAAPLTHLAWLAAFFWMATLSFNVARTLTSKVVDKSREPTTRRLLLFMLFAWGTSLVIVCVCIALHFCQCVTTGPIYASPASCYIVNYRVNLLAFGVPAALAMLVSVGLFVFTVIHVRSSRRSTRLARNETKLQEAKVEIVIYFRLAVLMGVTWVFGFLTAVVEGYAMLFVFVILNSLQGLLIFINFCCTARVWRMLTERYGGRYGVISGRASRGKKAAGQGSSGTQSQTQNTDTTRL